MTTKRAAAAARKSLFAILGKSRVIYTKVNTVAKSGMSRQISCYVVDDIGDIRDVSRYVSEILGWPQGKTLGVKVQGCGMDMGFHLVYQLSLTLFPRTPAGPSGGYVLRQRWL